MSPQSPNFLPFSLPRCISREDKTFALGIKYCLTSLLAFIPSPIVFGALMDKACIFWGKSSCGESTNCWVYDAVAFRENMNYVTSALVFLSTLVNMAVWIYSRNLSIFDEEEQEEGEKKVSTNKLESQ